MPPTLGHVCSETGRKNAAIWSARTHRDPHTKRHPGRSAKTQPEKKTDHLIALGTVSHEASFKKCVFLSEASPPAPRSQNEPTTHPPGFPTGPTRERSRQRPSRSQRSGTETWGHPGNPSKNGQASKTGSAPRPRIGGLRSYRGTMEFQKKMGPGSGPEIGPTTPPTDAVAAREKLVSPSFRAGISGPKTGSNPGPPFFKKQRKRAEKISPATTAVIVAPVL